MNFLYRFIADRDLARSNAPALLGLILPFIVLFGQEAGLIAGRFVLVFAVIFGWQMAFRRLRGQHFGPEGLVSALLFAMLTPPDAPYWQLVLGASFGIVLGELIFGGRGRNIVHPVVVGLAFLMFSFTGEPYKPGPEFPVWTLAPALLLLLISGQMAWRMLVPALVVLAGVHFSGGSDIVALLASGGIVMAFLFLAADPVTSAATNAGRIVQGALTALLAVLFMQAGAPFGAMVFAILVMSIFSPLIDQCVIMFHVRLREKRHG